MKTEPSEIQYDHAARFLDGEPIELTAAERHLTEEIGKAEHGLAGRLDLAVPAGVLRRTSRLLEQTVRPRLRRLLPVAMTAAAAILAALTVVWLLPDRRPAPTGRQMSPDALAETYADENEHSVVLDMIAMELDDLEASIVVPLSARPVETDLDALQLKVNTFWLEEAGYWPDEG